MRRGVGDAADGDEMIWSALTELLLEVMPFVKELAHSLGNGVADARGDNPGAVKVVSAAKGFLMYGAQVGGNGADR